MSGGQFGRMKLAASNSQVFTNSLVNDLLIYNSTPNSKVLIGSTNTFNEVAPLTITSNVISLHNLEVNGTTTISGDILPTENEMYNLGSSNMRFKDLFLSGNTIVLGNTSISSRTSNSISIAAIEDTPVTLIVNQLQFGTGSNAIIATPTKSGLCFVSGDIPLRPWFDRNHG